MFQTLTQAETALQELKGQNRKIDMTRGKPGTEQLDLTDRLFHQKTTRNNLSLSGEDVRNYGGGVAGLIEARELMAPLLGLDPRQTIVSGNSSLQLMASYLKFRVLPAVQTIRNTGGTPKMLAPVPGYDRHYGMTKHFGIEMIPVPFNAEGPNMEICEELMQQDPNILGIWCIPKFSNPSGHTYSTKTIQRMAFLPALSKGVFQVMWDNAYAVHDFNGYAAIASIMEHAQKAGTADSIAVFASTSKITYAGAGISAIGLSEPQFAAYSKYLEFETIGPDKLAQLRHVEALGDFQGLLAHMKGHAELLRPRFDAVTTALQEMAGGIQGVSFNKPEGGYFIDLNVPGIAKEVVDLCAGAGVKLTPAGAAFPYGDPENGQIRIAPSCPSPEEARFASEVIGVAINVARLGTVPAGNCP